MRQTDRDNYEGLVKEYLKWHTLRGNRAEEGLDYLRRAKKQERQKIKERVEGMKKEIKNPDDILGNLKPNGFNQAIDEILTYLND